MLDVDKCEHYEMCIYKWIIGWACIVIYRNSFIHAGAIGKKSVVCDNRPALPSCLPRDRLLWGGGGGHCGWPGEGEFIASG